MDYAFEFVINNGGIDTEEDYPYKERNGVCDQYRVSITFLISTALLKWTKYEYNIFFVLSIELKIYFYDTIVMQKNAKVVSIDSYEDVPVYNEKALQKAVANQPVSIAIEAGGRDFQHYKSVMFLFSHLAFQLLRFN